VSSVFVLRRRQLVAKQMAKMPQLIDDYRSKLKKADEQERQREAKRHALLEEARDYFGFKIDPRDARFERMQEMKEEEKKKLKKLKKKEAKTTRWLDVMKKEQPPTKS
jgi:Growth arrest and DNA-damage-inducible proteins-interacting protein 1